MRQPRLSHFFLRKIVKAQKAVKGRYPDTERVRHRGLLSRKEKVNGSPPFRPFSHTLV